MAFPLATWERHRLAAFDILEHVGIDTSDLNQTSDEDIARMVAEQAPMVGISLRTGQPATFFDRGAYDVTHYLLEVNKRSWLAVLPLDARGEVADTVTEFRGAMKYGFQVLREQGDLSQGGFMLRASYDSSGGESGRVHLLARLDRKTFGNWTLPQVISKQQLRNVGRSIMESYARLTLP